ncbi:hypothetical protein [Microbacterium abyssi]|uniref:hypothetical protein n=1 Tax=Microbacterium abyssi TaxID=2782166 RepID=UPI001888AD0D|nr:hypothetical protein [Microbacterium sp. A18JL241]
MSDQDENQGESAAHATDVTPSDVARKRGFGGDAVAPADNPDTDPVGTEGESGQPDGSTRNEEDPEARMTADPAPHDPDAPLPHSTPDIDAPDADAPSDEPR